MRKILMMLFVSAVSLLANGQVVKSINDGNMKIRLKPSLWQHQKKMLR